MHNEIKAKPQEGKKAIKIKLEANKVEDRQEKTGKTQETCKKASQGQHANN